MKCTKALLVFTMIVLGPLSIGANAASTQTLTLDHEAQSNLELTVYNNFALVRDTRKTVLPRGEMYLEYKEVAQTIEPSSVIVTSARTGKINVLEQSYRYDLLNRQSLLETYIGRKLKYSRTVPQGDVFEKVLREGILLSTNPEIVDFGDEIEISPEGVISLPDLPDGLTLNPTLVWLLYNERTGEHDLTTSYLANQISWHADYVLNLDTDADTMEISSWATIRNDSGTVFENAQVRLVAGNVNKAAAQPKVMFAAADMRVARSESAISTQATGAYQAFGLPRRTTLLNHESKQIQFVSAEAVAVNQTFRLRSQVATYLRSEPEQGVVMAELSFVNSKDNNLGLPLAQGVARVYNAGIDQADLLGETQLKATPAGQDVLLQLGQAFDLSVKRTQTRFVRLSDRSFEVSYDIKVSNARSKPAAVIVEEQMHGDWQIEESSVPLRRRGQLAETELTVPGNGDITLSYRVRIKI